jgi:hypothetical protein
VCVHLLSHTVHPFEMSTVRKRMSKLHAQHRAMRVYMTIVKQRRCTLSSSLQVRGKPRRNAVPVRAKPILACCSQAWLYFKSHRAAKLCCFGNNGSKMHTGITYALRSRVGSVLGWFFEKVENVVDVKWCVVD